MMRLDAVLALFTDLDAAELRSWIEQRWVQPETETPGSETVTWIFHEIDIARVRLVYDLRRDLGTPEDMMPLVLSLLDQVYELRSVVKSIQHALRDQPPEVQSAVLAALRPAERPKPDDL
jgi:chaperone modulatory protein CbpM